MRKPLIGAALLTVAIFLVGYLIGQARGVTPSSAAGSPSTQAQTQQTQTPSNQNNCPGGLGIARGGPHADGTVTAINGDTLTVKADSDQGQTGEQTNVTNIVLNSSTQYRAGPGATAGKSSIKVGSYVIAVGSLSSDGETLTASTVAVMPTGVGGPGFHQFGYFRGDGAGQGNAPAFNGPDSGSNA